MLIVAGHDVDVPAVGHRRPDRARRRDRRDRIGRPVRAGGGQGAGPQHRPRRARDRREVDGDRRATSASTRTTPSRSKSCSAACPSTCPKRRASTAESLTPREIVAELDKYVVGQAAGQARRGDRAAQPHAAAEAAAGDGRGDRAEEHPDDRPDRRRQDRDRAPAGAAGAVAVHQGRGVEVHRGRLRRPRRRVDGARPRRARPSTWCARSGSRKCARRRAQNAEERLLDLLLPPLPAAADYDEQAGADARAGAARRASSCASSCAPAGSTAAVVEIDVREKSLPVVRDHRRLVGRGSGHQPEGHAAGAVPGPDEEAADAGARGARVPRAGRRAEADRHGQRRAHRGRARRAGRHHLHRRDRQDRRPRRRPRPGRQPRRRAARHPADRRRHDRQHQVRHGARPITSCSSPPARSTSRSRPT